MSERLTPRPGDAVRLTPPGIADTSHDCDHESVGVVQPGGEGGMLLVHWRGYGVAQHPAEHLRVTYRPPRLT